MLNLILFGPPGSGKGTQAEKLVEEYLLAHISTGELFRAEMEAGTALGLEAKEYMSRGELVPDAVTIGMLRNRMAQHTGVHGFIFDGFPRTEPQARALDQLLPRCVVYAVEAASFETGAPMTAEVAGAIAAAGGGILAEILAEIPERAANGAEPDA